MPKKKTHEQYIKEIYDLVGNEYSILTRYNKSSEKITVRHNSCGHEFEIGAGSFLNRQGCKKCAGTLKKTTEDFKIEIYNITNGEYELLGEYINAHTKLDILHRGCERIYTATPNDFLGGSRCPICFKNNQMSPEKFQEKINELYGEDIEIIEGFINSNTKIKFKLLRNKKIYSATPYNLLKGTYGREKLPKITYEIFKSRLQDNYEIIGNYINTNHKVEIKHKKCGYRWEAYPQYDFSKNSCPHCAGNLTITKEQVENLIKNKFGLDYKVLDSYKNSSTKMRVLHEYCNTITKVNYNNMCIKKEICQICFPSKTNRKISTVSYRELVYEKVKDEYTILGEYINSNSKIKTKHNICGHEWYISYNKFIKRGNRCPECFGTHSKNTDKFKKQIVEIYGDEYIVIGEYYGHINRIKMKHKECGENYFTTPANILNGRRCPCMRISKGEKKIQDMLIEFDIQYLSQYRFDSCRHEKTLPFDFAITNDSKEILLLIEYDGQQHFRPVNFNGISDEKAIENFELTQLRDLIKNKYCEDNSVPLLRIPYWEFDNIESILTEYLSQFNLISK